MKTKMKKERKSQLWDDRFYVKVYMLAKDGLKQYGIAEVLGVNTNVFSKWLRDDPAFREALELGQQRKSSLENVENTLLDYVAGRLPPELKRTWDQIMDWDGSEFRSEETLERILEDKGTRFRQYLWLHALVYNNFNMSEACRLSGVGYGTLQQWKQDDIHFPDILNIVLHAKKDLVEGALMRLVAAGEVSAIIFASRTLNADRGYGNKATITHQGEVALKMAEQISIEEILNELSVEDQLRILDVIRRKQKKTQPLQMIGNLP